MTLHPDDAAALAAAALALVRAGQVVGLGTGRAAEAFIRALAAAVGQGLRITAVPTSEASAVLAREAGIPLQSLDGAAAIDVTVDGADEVDPRLNLIKGYGGALVREKIVAAASRRFVVVAGRDKLVPALGSRGRLPVEVVPFAAAFCARRLADLGIPATIRTRGSAPVVTDNGNLILDGAVGRIEDPAGLEQAVRAVPGVVGTGLFLGMAERVLVGDGGRVLTLARGDAGPDA
jgi:ribose 5-phosphate isomerase A